jgi:ABC-type glycerol-3-phosphate transport system substrate-binding protein
VIRALALASLVAGLALAGCGGDDSGGTTAPTVSIPAITAPLAPTTTTAPAATTTPTGTTGTGSGGTSPPDGANPGKPDSETNDVPPPAGSPQEAFEKQCEQNPAACG